MTRSKLTKIAGVTALSLWGLIAVLPDPPKTHTQDSDQAATTTSATTKAACDYTTVEGCAIGDWNISNLDISPSETDATRPYVYALAHYNGKSLTGGSAGFYLTVKGHGQRLYWLTGHVNDLAPGDKNMIAWDQPHSLYVPGPYTFDISHIGY